MASHQSSAAEQEAGTVREKRTRLTPRVMGRLRLVSQGLLRQGQRGGGFPDVQSAVRGMLAMQAQDLPSALWAVGQRVSGIAGSDVRAALDAGTVVRSWPFRGTLHLVAPDDLKWILGITSKRMMSSAAPRHRQLGIGPDDVAQCRDIAGGLVSSGKAASRDQLFSAFEAAGQATKAQRGVHLLWILCQEAFLVQGPTAGPSGRAAAQQLFVAFDEWIPSSRRLEREEGMAELALRYLRSHGPATERDFAWWSSTPITEVRTALAAVRGQLVEVMLEGTPYWLSPEVAALLDEGVPGAKSVLALPGFDEFLLGYTDRSLVLPAEYAQHVVPGGNGVFKRMIVQGGQIVGTWTREGSGRNLRVEAVPFDHSGLGPAAQRSFERQAARYVEFLMG